MNSSKKDTPGEDSLDFPPSPTGIECYLIVRSHSETTPEIPKYDKHVLPLGPGFKIGTTALNVLDDHQFTAVVGLIKKRNAQTFEDGQWIVTGLSATEGAESFKLMIQICQYGARESSRDQTTNVTGGENQHGQERDIGQYDLEKGFGEVEVLRKEETEIRNDLFESDSASTIGPRSPTPISVLFPCAPTPVYAPSTSAALPPLSRKKISDTFEKQPPKETRKPIEIKIDRLDKLEDIACKAAKLQFRYASDVFILVLEKVLKERKKLMGDQHYKTLITTTNLHYNQTLSQNYVSNETMKLMENVHAGLEEALGDKDENTLSALHVVAVGHRYNGSDKANSFLEDVLKGRTETLGKYHEDTLHVMKYLVDAYYGLELWARAEELAKSLLEYQTEALGRNHKETLDTLEKLAKIYLKLEKLDEGGECLKTLAECWMEVSDAHKACLHFFLPY